MKDNYQEVLNVFFDNPSSKFYIREIARLTRLNPNTVINISDKLIKEGLIKKEKKKHVVELFAEVDEKFKILKRVNNLGRIYDSGLIEFLDEKFSSEAISVIGSYSRGEDIEESDMDIVIISKKEYENLDLSKFEKILNRKIHLIVCNYKKISNEFYINLINGIVLKGYLNKKWIYLKNGRLWKLFEKEYC